MNNKRIIDHMTGKSDFVPDSILQEASTIEDPVNHPSHYTSHPSGIECIDITEHFNFNIGNAIKYLWRHEGKNGIEDLQKAAWYVQREIERREKYGV